jgi:hypothetical protein
MIDTANNLINEEKPKQNSIRSLRSGDQTVERARLEVGSHYLPVSRTESRMVPQTPLRKKELILASDTASPSGYDVEII